MNVSNFDEYIEYLPNVTNGGRGPGQSTIYIRGMAVDPVNVFLSAAQGSTPNVALYLDEQPVTVPGRNLDIYVADMERIEVLPGPQGTLYGASSQAGTVRLITNKPKFNTSEAGLNASVFGTSDGEASNNFDAFVNIPMIDDVWAVRGVFVIFADVVVVVVVSITINFTISITVIISSSSSTTTSIQLERIGTRICTLLPLNSAVALFLSDTVIVVL
jgi:hypothetical protein